MANEQSNYQDLVLDLSRKKEIVDRSDVLQFLTNPNETDPDKFLGGVRQVETEIKEKFGNYILDTAHGAILISAPKSKLLSTFDYESHHGMLRMLLVAGYEIGDINDTELFLQDSLNYVLSICDPEVLLALEGKDLMEELTKVSETVFDCLKTGAFIKSFNREDNADHLLPFKEFFDSLGLD